jgi:hypothetical protein
MTTRDTSRMTTPSPRDGTSPRASQLEDTLRVASDTFLARVERLQALEERKRELPPAEIVDLAKEIESLTQEILGWAQHQTELAEAAARPDAPEARPIAVIPPRSMARVLEEWRAAERALEAEQPGTLAHETIRADVERLREEYARAYHLHLKADSS